jgi:hypothetical protein
MVAHAAKNELLIMGALLRVLRQSDKERTPEEGDEETLRRVSGVKHSFHDGEF